MMEVPLGDTYYVCFTTRQYSDGAPTTLSGTPALSVKEEGNDTIITSGVSVDVDTGSTPVTGLNEASIAATSGNGYEIGKYYSVYISTGTVGGTSVVGEVVGHFRIMPAEDAGAGIKDVNCTHVSDTAQTANDNGADINAILADTGTDGVLIAAGAITDASLAGNMEIVFETDFGTNYNATRNAWVTNAQDFVGTTASDPFNAQVVAASVSAQVSADVTAISGDSTAADKLEESATAIVLATAVTGTLETTQFTTNLTETDDDHYKGRIIVFTTGNLANQATDITGYTGSTKTVAVTALTEAPANGDAFVIV